MAHSIMETDPQFFWGRNHDLFTQTLTLELVDQLVRIPDDGSALGTASLARKILG
jgi:hypothetical protein